MEHGVVSLPSPLCSLPPVTYRQSHDHPRPSCFRPLQADLAAVVLEYALHDREPQPRAAALGRIKRLKDPLPVIVGDAGPRVLDDDIEPSALPGNAGDDPERPSSGHGLHGVPHDVVERLLDLELIGADEGEVT